MCLIHTCYAKYDVPIYRIIILYSSYFHEGHELFVNAIGNTYFERFKF